jgi:hypothetical protein
MSDITLIEFVPGTKAKAEDVNLNFSTLKDAINIKAYTNGDSTQNFEVASAITSTQAIRKEQLDTEVKTLNAKIEGISTRFCIKSGKTTSGKGDLLNFSGTSVTIAAGGINPDLIASNYKGEITTISSDITIDMTGSSDGTYNIFTKTDGTAYKLANTIYKQPTRPTMVTGDIWLDTSVEPLNAIKYNGTLDDEFTDVPVGSITIASSTITEAKTFDFNQNSYDVNYQTQGYRFPNWGLGSDFTVNTVHTATVDGWLFIRSKLYQAATLYCTINGIELMISHENYTLDSSGGMVVIPICKGDTYNLTYMGNVYYLAKTFWPAKGAQ